MNTTSRMPNRLSGFALILGGMTGAVGQYFHPGDPQGAADAAFIVQYARQSTPVPVALYFAVMLILLGLPAVYVREREETGWAGLVGFLLLIWGWPIVDLVHSIALSSYLPTLVADSPERAILLTAAANESAPWAAPELLGFPLAVLGILFFGIVTIRARVLPGWPAWLMLAALLVRVIYTIIPALPEVGGSLNGILLCLAFAGFGYVLLMDQELAPQRAEATALMK